MISPAEARIAAHVCADGWLTTYIERNALQIVHGRRYHQVRKKYEIGYCNTDEGLLKEFCDDVQAVYGIHARTRSIISRVFRSKRVYDRIRELGGGGSYEWFIGKEITESDIAIKIHWLRAFFDDECTIDKTHSQVRVKSMNMPGLRQVRQLLQDVGIESSITGPNCDKSWYLTISRRTVPQYREKIGLAHNVKKQRLENLR